MRTAFVVRSKNWSALVPVFTFALGTAVVGIPGWVEHESTQREMLDLTQQLKVHQTELRSTQSELSEIKPKLARHLIREHARWSHAIELRQDWVKTFGYESSIRVKTPEQIAFPDRDPNQMVDELIRLSDTSNRPMEELVQQVVNGTR